MVANLACWLWKQINLSAEFLKITHTHIRYWSEEETDEEGIAYFGDVAVIKCVLYHQTLQHLDGYLTNLPELLQSCTDLPEQQPNQEVVLTEVICQRVIQLEVWGEEEEDEEIRTGWQRSNESEKTHSTKPWISNCISIWHN